MTEPPPLLEVRDLTKRFYGRRLFFSRGPAVTAVDRVNLRIMRGDSFGLVGESGCGKTTVGRLILNLLAPTSGEVIYNGQPVYTASPSEMLALRRKMQIIFQDPYSSLNPSFRVRQIVAEGYRRRADPGAAMGADLAALMTQVGLGPEILSKYPSQLSGGQRQRVGIARALAVGPEFIIADEPTSALDVSIQAQILNLFIDLQQQLRLTYLFISHNMGVIRYICNRVAVMYLGQIIEQGTTDDVLNRPAHPYTVGLLGSMPRPEDRVQRQRRLLGGELPSPTRLPTGCRFHPRCAWAKDICKQVEPPQIEIAPGHSAGCHFPFQPDDVRRIAVQSAQNTLRAPDS